MISLEGQTDQKATKISDEARLAIARGVQRGDPVAELEYLGLSVRTINLLENSDFHITRLEQLVARSRDELLSIPNITRGVLVEILSAVARYHELEDARRHMHKPLAERLESFAEISRN